MLDVVIRDHGPGIAPDEETRVFDKFHQIQPEGAQSGFGLGLAICKAIVEAHGGTIAARNAPGGGAEFRFTLAIDHRASTRAMNPNAPRTSLLLIEDDPQIQRFLAYRAGRARLYAAGRRHRHAGPATQPRCASRTS